MKLEKVKPNDKFSNYNVMSEKVSPKFYIYIYLL